MVEEPSDFLGTLSEAPLERLAGATRVLSVLRDTEFARGLYLPAPSEGARGEVAVLFRPFAWRKGAPQLWLLTSAGLSSRPQSPARIADRVISPCLELCAAFREPGAAQWGDFRWAWEQGVLKEMPGVPAIFSRFATIAQDFMGWLSLHDETFAIGDPILDCALLERFPSGVLVPPVPELLVSGLVPFFVGPSGRPTRAEIAPGEWLEKERIVASGDYVFLQIAPLLEDEHALAESEGGWRFFLNGLLPTDEEIGGGKEASAIITNLTRASRVPAYRATRAVRASVPPELPPALSSAPVLSALPPLPPLSVLLRPPEGE